MEQERKVIVPVGVLKPILADIRSIIAPGSDIVGPPIDVLNGRHISSCFIGGRSAHRQAILKFVLVGCQRVGAKFDLAAIHRNGIAVFIGIGPASYRNPCLGFKIHIVFGYRLRQPRRQARHAPFGHRPLCPDTGKRSAKHYRSQQKSNQMFSNCGSLHKHTSSFFGTCTSSSLWNQTAQAWSGEFNRSFQTSKPSGGASMLFQALLWYD